VEHAAQGLQAVELLPASLAARDMRFDERRVRCVELTVDEPAEQQLLVFARGHHLTLLD
jgi:hypothetical protein